MKKHIITAILAVTITACQSPKPAPAPVAAPKPKGQTLKWYINKDGEREAKFRTNDGGTMRVINRTNE